MPALPGSPGASSMSPAEALQRAGLAAVQEAKALTQAGFQGLILENFGDVPFLRTQVGPETISSMAVIAAAVREATKLPLGINVLRNDARAALAIASVTDCEMIRVNVLSGVAATDQGWIEGEAASLIRERERLGSPVLILADAHVKHARTVSSESIDLAIEELALRSMADAVIITGETTGRSVDMQKLIEASRAARAIRVPLLIGSGATAENLPTLLESADGIIVGSALRQSGRAGAPLDARRIRELVRAFKTGAARSQKRAVKSSGKTKKKSRRK